MDKEKLEAYDKMVTDVTPYNYFKLLIWIGVIFIVYFVIFPTLFNVFTTLDFSKLWGILFGHSYIIFNQVGLISNNYFLNEGLRNSIFLHLFIFGLLLGLVYYGIYKIWKHFKEVHWEHYILFGFLTLLFFLIGEFAYVYFEFDKLIYPFSGIGKLVLNFVEVCR